MAWTVAFALLGAVIFSMMIAPVLASFFFRRGTRDWQNPVVAWLTERYQRALGWTVDHRWTMVAVTVIAVCVSGYLFQMSAPNFCLIWMKAPSGCVAPLLRAPDQARAYV